MADPAPLLTRRRVLAAAAETTPGSAETLDAADAAMNVFDIEIQPNIEWAERPGQSALSPLAGITQARAGQVSFKTEVHGSGNAGAPVPTWASVLLPACGWGQATSVFSPDSRPPGAASSTLATVTIGVYENGVYKVLRGCMGTFRIVLTSGGRVMIEWTFTGIWDTPSDVGLLTPTYPTVTPLKFQGATFTIGSWSPKVSEAALESGGEVYLRPNAGDAAAYDSAVIVARRPVGSFNPEANLVADEDVYGEWLAGTSRALQIILGSGSADGNTVQIDAPAVQYTNVQELDRDGVQADDIGFQCNRSAAAGDDEMTFTFS